MSASGGAQVDREFTQAGDSAKRNLDKIRTAANGPSASLKAVSAASSDVRGKFEAMASRAGVAGTALSALGPVGVAVAVALAGLTVGASKAIEEINSADNSFVKLQSVLKATGNETGNTIDDLSGLADQLEATSRVSAESVNDASATLATFGVVTGENFKRTIKVANDMRAALGQDLVGATRLVAQALAEPDKAAERLRRSGILLTSSTKDLIDQFIRAREPGKAVDAILSDLEKRVGGSASAEGKTLAGQIDILKASFGNLFEELGREHKIDKGALFVIDAFIKAVDRLRDSVKGGNISQEIVAVNKSLIEAQDKLTQMHANGALPLQIKYQEEKVKDLQKQVDDLIARASAASSAFDEKQSADAKERAESEKRAAATREANALSARQAAVREILKDINSEVALVGLVGRKREEELAALKAIKELEKQSPGATEDDKKRVADRARSVAGELYLTKQKQEADKASLDAATKAAEEDEKNRLKASERAKDLINDQAKIHLGYENEVKDNERLLAALGKGADAYQTELVYIEMRNKMREAGMPILADEEEAYRKLAQTIGRQRQELIDSKKDSEALKEGARDVFQTLFSGFESSVVEGQKLGDVVQALEKDFARLILRLAVLKPAERGLDKFFNGGGGKSIFDFIFGSGSSAGIGGGTSGYMVADGAGGMVPMIASGGQMEGGKWYRVNEYGQEFFKSDDHGMVIGADATKQMGGSGPAVIQYNTIDARGADASVDTKIRLAMEVARKLAIQDVMNQANRGGQFARSVGRR